MDSNEEYKKPVELGCCIGVPLLLLGVVLSIPYACFLEVVKLCEEFLFRKRMQKHDRFIKWNDLETKLEAGQGILIVETQNKMLPRIWWTEENAVALRPVNFPTDEELEEISLSYFGSVNEAHPFVEWCFNRYLHPENGRAYLTKPPNLVLGDILCSQSSKTFQEEFPQIQIVKTIRKW